MPRRPPSRLRGGIAPPATTAIPDVPLATSRALDRLDRPELTALRIREALRVWQHVASLPHSTLSTPHSDWSEFVGPQARAELEEALSALSPRLARPLRRVIEQADEQFRAKTVNNPRAGTSDPWWARRWSH